MVPPPRIALHSKPRLIFHADGSDEEKRGFLVKINASVEGGCLHFDMIYIWWQALGLIENNL